ncbi:MAG: response regulator [Deltaproteobacteria bacterium]|nr:response regulator [Deltaproteobacteria bacterium]
MARIIIAEDDPPTQIIVARTIEKLGHCAYISPNGEHAYEALKANNKFELLISDVMMPKMDGRQLIKTLRGSSEFKTLPVIIMSAVVRYKEIADLLELGASYFLPKPLDINDLKENINRGLK